MFARALLVAPRVDVWLTAALRANGQTGYGRTGTRKEERAGSLAPSRRRCICNSQLDEGMHAANEQREQQAIGGASEPARNHITE
ncbi:hypothetical protein CLCR_07822 [Cladophialophora carrionii]|uniref:Uncharacterized protein n=1 Tax=Cladophialophora carrionii TaxID=86049 RepID=A0A1C1CQ93_9EURO|nr:hypothetical protein CLCR_07822 [Cladophialophora carrionii]